MSALAVESGRVFHPVRGVIRDGEIARVKFCVGCNQEKRVTEDRNSDFPLNGRRPDGRIRGWKPICKKCYAAHAKAKVAANREAVLARRRELHAQHMANDPEYVGYLRDYARTTRALKRVRDPAFVEAERRRSREWKRRKTVEDPDYFTPARRSARVAAKTVSPSTTGTLPRIPAEPFRRWLDAYALALGFNRAQLAKDLEMTERRVASLREREYKNVALDVVDRALQNACLIVRVDGFGVLGLNDLYTEEELAGSSVADA